MFSWRTSQKHQVEKLFERAKTPLDEMMIIDVVHAFKETYSCSAAKN